MKKLKNVIGLVAIFSLLFIACKSKDSSEARDIQLLTDSTAYLNNSMGDTSKTVVTETIKPNHNSNSHSGAAVGNNPNQSTSSSTNSSTTNANGNKGWSKAAQGAVIGGAIGGVGGAIVSKNKVQGAVIGAAAGAAGGYIIGRGKDKKDGRVRKQK
ncbi:MAG: YMGG-like glycine zipper-containing protein [Ginsengibacter sp.]